MTTILAAEIVAEFVGTNAVKETVAIAAGANAATAAVVRVAALGVATRMTTREDAVLVGADNKIYFSVSAYL